MEASLTFDDGPEPRWTAGGARRARAARARARRSSSSPRGRPAQPGARRAHRWPRGTRSALHGNDAPAATPSHDRADDRGATPTRRSRAWDVLGVRPDAVAPAVGSRGVVDRRRSRPIAACGIVGWDADTARLARRHRRRRCSRPRRPATSATAASSSPTTGSDPAPARRAAPRRSRSSEPSSRLAGDRGLRACRVGRTDAVARRRATAGVHRRARRASPQGAAARDREPRAASRRTLLAPSEPGRRRRRQLPSPEQSCTSSATSRAQTLLSPRIVDGHLNAVERLAVHAEDRLRERELTAVAELRFRLGVWGPTHGRARPSPPASATAGCTGSRRSLRRGRAAAGDRLAGDLLAYVDLTEGPLSTRPASRARGCEPP